jgi:hypothetical protein
LVPDPFFKAAKYSGNGEADGVHPVAQKGRKIWSRVTAIPLRSRTPHPNVPNEALDCSEQALLSQFWSKLFDSNGYPWTSGVPANGYGFTRKTVFANPRIGIHQES